MTKYCYERTFEGMMEQRGVTADSLECSLRPLILSLAIVLEQREIGWSVVESHHPAVDWLENTQNRFVLLSRERIAWQL